MSLIAEALQKAGGPPVHPPGPPTRVPPWRKVTLLVVCAAAALILAGRVAERILTGGSSTQERPLPPATNAKPISGLQLLRAADSQWRLSGVIRATDGKSVALINGRVVEEGRTIQGAKLVKVEKDRVELESNGKVQTIKLQ